MDDKFLPENIEKTWTQVAEKQLLGKKIVKVRYMSQAEADSMGWYKRPVVFQLDDGNLIYPSMDDEGNDGGALFTNSKSEPTLPVI